MAPTKDELERGTAAQDEENLETSFPEGGLRAWAAVAGSFLVQFCGFGRAFWVRAIQTFLTLYSRYTNAFGVYQDFYVRHYLTTSTSSAISSVLNPPPRWIGSVSAFLIFAGGLLSGRLYDRGYFYPLIWGGSFLCTLSLFMLSLCKPDQYYQIFLAQALGVGLGAGIMYVPSIAVISHYFQRRRTLAMCIPTSGSCLGAVVHAIMLNNTLHDDHLGFGSAVRMSAGLVGGLLLIACLLMHPRLPPPQTHLPLRKSISRFVRDVPCMLTVGAYYFPLFYLQLEAVKHGIDEHVAFYTLVILNASGFFGRLLPGFLPNRLGVIDIATLSSAVVAVFILCLLALSKTMVGVLVFSVLCGFFGGMFFTTMPPIIAVLTPNIEGLGLRIGIGFAIVGLGGLVGPPIEGALLTSRFIWWRPTLFSGVRSVT
ncbi:major facilitator superfamily domain-containing protein, partial [Roridomyces roridus]